MRKKLRDSPKNYLKLQEQMWSWVRQIKLKSKIWQLFRCSMMLNKWLIGPWKNLLNSRKQSQTNSEISKDKLENKSLQITKMSVRSKRSRKEMNLSGKKRNKKNFAGASNLVRCQCSDLNLRPLLRRKRRNKSMTTRRWTGIIMAFKPWSILDRRWKRPRVSSSEHLIPNLSLK